MVSEEGPVRAVGGGQFSGQRCKYHSQHHEQLLEGSQAGSEHVKGIFGCSLENGLNLRRLNLFRPETDTDQSVLLAAPLRWRPGSKVRRLVPMQWSKPLGVCTLCAQCPASYLASRSCSVFIGPVRKPQDMKRHLTGHLVWLSPIRFLTFFSVP